MGHTQQQPQEARLAGRVTVDQLHIFYHYTYGTRSVVKDGVVKRQRVPVWTHCFAVDSSGRYAKGSALCSRLDNPDKAEGRHWAYRRAVRGYYTQQTEWGQTPTGSSVCKVMVGHPLSDLEKKFVAMATKTVDTVTPSGA